ncbi:MAG: hypothetical protein GYB66_08805 [Chloroflexi bacterium]|nr:hypothetical protein [Chloroflexota bacterium]
MFSGSGFPMMPTPRSTRTARLIRQRRKLRSKRGGNAIKIGRWAGCSIGVILLLMVGGLLATTGSVVAVYAIYARELPEPELIANIQAENFQTTVFYDRTGTVSIYEVIDPEGGDRQYIYIDEVPEHFLQATIAIEDASFYDNPGFDVEGILRAMWVNVTTDRIEGGSTITQQLVRNQMLSIEERNTRSLDRKTKEIILAAELSRLYSKDQILEWYINTNFYGNLAYGVEAAARVYFDKSARNLTLAESALLAAIPQSPSQNPLENPEIARNRQRIVLQAMVDQGYITPEEMQDALNETIVLKPAALRFEIMAPHFAWYARNETERILNDLDLDGADMVLGGGLRVYTTLDLDLQRQLECVARSHVTRLDSGNPSFVHNTNAGTPCTAADFLPELSADLAGNDRVVTNSSGVIMRAQTGEIVAMLGSVDFWNETIGGEYNAALALRQPASTFKPFVYVTAFINPIDASTVVTPATMTYDVRTEFDNGTPDPYVPENIDLRYHGPVSVREALARSYNIPAVQVLNWVGLNRTLRTAHSMGINSMTESISAYGLSLALGTAEARLLDLTYAYNVFNNNGIMVGSPVSPDEARAGFRQLNPVAVLRIEAPDGEILWEYGEDEGTFDRRAVLEPGMSYMITDILADTEARTSNVFPRGNALELGRPAAAKTGTSDDFRDSWTIGYTPYYTAGIWVGNNDNTSMTDVTGLVGAAPIWHAVMEYIHVRDALPPDGWAQPDTIVTLDVCRNSGLRPTENCPTKPEIFYYDPNRNIDYRPQRADSYWKSVNVNTCNNTLATPYSPPACVTERIYFDYPEELQDWALTHGEDLIPTTYDPADSTPLFSPVAIISPSLLDQVRGTIEIRGNARDPDLDYFRLEIGEGSTPSTWRQIGERQTVGGGDIVLGTWDTNGVPDGLYTLRLTMVRTDATSEFANREVIVDNTAPTVRLLSPDPQRTYSQDQDVFVTLSAEPADNRQVAYIEFYADGEVIGRATQGPYELRWEIPAAGETIFWAVVSDRAGNLTESERIAIQMVP